MSATSSSRRLFMKSAAAAGAVTLGGLTPSTVLGANDRLNFAVIGVGGMGRGHLNNLLTYSSEDNTKVIAVCDVYKRRLTNAEEMVRDKGQQAQGFIDYRKVLDNNDVDVVLIATPDHWHSKMAIEAMEAGKHVYLEKPMTLTAEQAIEVRDAVRRTGKKLQVGPQYTSESQYWNAHELITRGDVGKVTWAQGSYNRNVRGGAFNVWFKIDETAGPAMPGEDYVDWDMWLGHKWGLAPRIPWNPEHFFRFRKYFQYNGGVATDLLYHILAPLLIAIAGPEGQYPERVNASGGLYILKDGRDIPDVFMMAIDYPGEFTIYLESVLTNNTQQPTRIYAQYATLDLSNHGNLDIEGNGDFKQEFRNNFGGYEQVTVHSERINGDHHMMERNLMDAIRSGEKLYCNAELGCATMVAIKMGVESYRQSKTLTWDSRGEKVAVG